MYAAPVTAVVPQRRDGLYEFIRSLLAHSFALDCMAETLPQSWSHVEELIAEHFHAQQLGDGSEQFTRLKKLVPSVGCFHTTLPLKAAFTECV